MRAACHLVLPDDIPGLGGGGGAKVDFAVRAALVAIVGRAGHEAELVLARGVDGEVDGGCEQRKIRSVNVRHGYGLRPNNRNEPLAVVPETVKRGALDTSVQEPRMGSEP